MPLPWNEKRKEKKVNSIASLIHRCKTLNNTSAKANFWYFLTASVLGSIKVAYLTGTLAQDTYNYMLQTLKVFLSWKLTFKVNFARQDVYLYKPMEHFTNVELDNVS